jgi:hypothetical protein
MAKDTKAYDVLVVMASYSENGRDFTLSGLGEFLRDNSELGVVANNFDFPNGLSCEELGSALDLARTTGVITCPQGAKAERYEFDRERVVSETPSALENLGSDYNDTIDVLGKAFAEKSFAA